MEASLRMIWMNQPWDKNLRSWIYWMVKKKCTVKSKGHPLLQSLQARTLLMFCSGRLYMLMIVLSCWIAYTHKMRRFSFSVFHILINITSLFVGICDWYMFLLAGYSEFNLSFESTRCPQAFAVPYISSSVEVSYTFSGELYFLEVEPIYWNISFWKKFWCALVHSAGCSSLRAMWPFHSFENKLNS